MKINKFLSTVITLLASSTSLCFAQVKDSGVAGQVRQLKTATGALQIFSNNSRVYMIKSSSLRAERIAPNQRRRMAAQVQFERPFSLKKHKKLVDNSVAAADIFLRRNRQYFGVPNTNLIPQLGKIDHLGKIHVRYKVHCDYDIYGAELVAHLDAKMKVESVNGNTSTCPAKQKIGIKKSDAKDLALDFWRTEGGIIKDGATPKVTVTKLAYFVPSLFTTVSSSDDVWPQQWDVNQTYLTYVVVVMSNENHVGGTYFIDAQNGAWRFYISGAQRMNRQIYDCNGGTSSSGCNLSRSEGQSPVSVPDVNLWYDDVAGVNDFLLSTVGRNGANGLGGLTPGSDATVAYVNYGAAYFAPVLGGSQYLPPTMTSNSRIETTHEWTDPASFAHEYFHGVEYFTHSPGGMTYQSQTGALMESNCNIFAEAYIQATYGSQPDDWKIIFSSASVDQGSYPQGFHVDMRYPEYDSSIFGAYGDPDSLYSRDYYCGSTAVDNGGVHANSYPITKAAWLLSTGGNFNNCTIEAIGLDKVHQIWYRAMANYYTASANFAEAYTDIQSACNDLYPAPSTVCQQVTNALQAVEFNQAGRCVTTTARAVPACAPSSCVAHAGGDTVSSAPYVTYLTRTYRDRCLEDGSLTIHHSCNSETPSKLTYSYQPCSNGCSNGACL